MTSRAGTWLLRGATGLTLAFIYLPLLVIVPVRVQPAPHARVADSRA